MYFTMETVLVQLNDPKAYKLLEDLETLNVLKIINRDSSYSKILSEKYKGKLPNEVAEELQEYILKSRSEWKDPT